MIAGVVFVQPIPVALTNKRQDRFRYDDGWTVAVRDDGSIRLMSEEHDFTVYDVPYVIVTITEPASLLETQPALLAVQEPKTGRRAKRA